MQGSCRRLLVRGRGFASQAGPSEREKRLVISRILRVDHAWDAACVSLLEGQRAVLGDGGRDGGEVPGLSLGERTERERRNLGSLEGCMADYRSRPSALLPLLSAGGWLAGVGTAALGPRAAAAAAEAAGQFVGDLANSGLREVREERLEGEAALRGVLRQLRDTERGLPDGGWESVPTSPQEVWEELKGEPEPHLTVLRWGVSGAGRIAMALATKL